MLSDSVQLFTCADLDEKPSAVFSYPTDAYSTQIASKACQNLGISFDPACLVLLSARPGGETRPMKSVSTLRSLGAANGMIIYVVKPDAKPLSSLNQAPRPLPNQGPLPRLTTPQAAGQAQKIPPGILRPGGAPRPIPVGIPRPGGAAAPPSILAHALAAKNAQGQAVGQSQPTHFPALRPSQPPAIVRQPEPIARQPEPVAVPVPVPVRQDRPSGRTSGRAGSSRHPVNSMIPTELEPLLLYYHDFEVRTKTGTTVFPARENSTGLMFVMKMLKGQCTTDAGKEVFYQELMKMYNVEHGCLLHLHGFSDSPLALCYDYCPNGALDSVLDMEVIGNEPRGWNNTKKMIVMYGVAEGMRWLHSKRVMHRNLKPSNVLLDENFWPLIGDVGFTRDYDRNPGYMAPEMLSGGQYKSKVDVFAYGMIVFHIIVGSPPFDGCVPFQKVKETIMKGQRPEIPSKVPSNFARLISSCWNQDPTLRPTFNVIVEEFVNGSYTLPGVDDSEYRRFQRTMTPQYEDDRRGIVDDLRDAAERGEVNAQMEVAMCYLRGRGAVKSVKEASRYLAMASDAGSVRAQFIYAVLLMRFKKDNTRMMRYLKLAADGGEMHACLLYARLTRDKEEAQRYVEKAVQMKNPAALLTMAGRLQKTDIAVANRYYKEAADAGSPVAQCHWAISLHNGNGGVKVDMREANRYYKMAADQGNTRAQCNYAYNLQRGDGCDKDVELANIYYKLSAEAGYANAQYNYAYNLMNGIGVAPDVREANRLYKLAADQGNTGAQFSYASNLMKGNGVEKDLVKANEYFRSAADKGNALAQCQYALNLMNGNGVKENAQEANRYYKLSADQGVPRAQCNYAFSLQKGTGIPVDLVEANRYYKMSADQGYAVAQYNYAFNLENGNGIAKDAQEANRYYKMSADQGNSNAQFNYAMNLLKGNGVAQNLDECNKYLKMSVDQNNARAQYQYGLHLQKGLGIAKDPKRANELFRLAADQGNASAQFYLAYNLFNGNGVGKNPSEANRYYKLAADQGNANAQCNLACSYLNGIGAEKNIAEANRYYKMSADAGNAVAQYNYGMHLMNGVGETANAQSANKYFKMAADQGNVNAQLCYGMNLYNGNGVKKDQDLGRQYVKKSADGGNKLAAGALQKLK